MITPLRVGIIAACLGIGLSLFFDVHGQVAATETPPEASTAPATQPAFAAVDVTVGSGPAAKIGDTVSMLYTGRLYGTTTVFDSTAQRGDKPFEFVLGQGQVIAGWDQGIIGMKVGGKRKLVIPPDLGYGAQGAGDAIPSNASLEFDVQLVGIR